MADLIVSQFVTLNGVIEANGAPENHPHGGWQFKSAYGDDHLRYKEEEVDEGGSLLLGRKTYDIFAAFWPREQGRVPDKLNSMPKYVVSATLTTPEWENAKVIGFDDVADLKRADGGPILVYGSARLTYALLGADLVDEYRALIHPVLVAGGLRMFPDVEQMRRFRLAESVAYDSGVLLATYRRA